ncbi:hypothetical protein NRB16_07995 [Pseudomonas sp. LJDD11]|uniref:hypothetical protein n=1 Tax=Pseudomonas sp. LJDD11 TaxID=2931984 RepID=UPI00211BC1E9|nr:hypothetical protein [Pseudomonas sp. LJDD11]MCQ9423461.1 hypothetical protein [Pseudomonas sp. LJDD11]
MSKFSWEKKSVNGKIVYQVKIGGHYHGLPCKTEEEANSEIRRLEQDELQREKDREDGMEP